MGDIVIEDVEIPVDNGKINLIGSIYYTKETPVKAPWVITLAGLGYSRNGKFVRSFSEKFANANYYVLSYDYRGHGDTAKQTGKNWYKFITEMYSDIHDAITWVLETQKERLLDEKIALFGRSIGGAIILTHGFIDKRAKKLIALVTRYDYASYTALKFSDEKIKKVSPKYFLEKDPSNNDRILIAHCKDDERIPFHNLQLIKEKLDLSEKNVIAYETGGHSFRGNRENIFNEAIRFLERD